MNHYRVLNRAVWGSRVAARLLLRLLIAAFVPCGPVVLGLDDAIKRRRGLRIAAKGIYRDPVRSHGHFLKAGGLRWLSLMLLAPVPWAGRVWALPFLTALAPSARHNQARGRAYTKLTDWGGSWSCGHGAGCRDAPWLVADGSFAALEFLGALCRHKVTCITRRRLDAALHALATPRQPGAKGRPRKTGERLAHLPAALLDGTTRWQRAPSPDGVAKANAASSLPPAPPRGAAAARPSRRSAGSRCVIRPAGSSRRRCCAPSLNFPPSRGCAGSCSVSNREVTFAETRAHLGVET